MQRLRILSGMPAVELTRGRRAPVPPWEQSELLLVDPSIWRFYRSAPHDLRRVYRDVEAALNALRIPHYVLRAQDHPIDIWVRDWGPVEGCFFDYSPSYAKGFYSPAAVRKARHALCKRSGQTFRSIPLVLDGGNLVHNGRVAILTEKVFRDNPQRTPAEIEETIASLGLEQVVFIPVESLDQVGHADGIVRFLSEEVLLVNDYEQTGFRAYRNRLLRRLTEINSPVEIVPFPWRCSDEKISGIWSAVGVYLNFIQTAHGILLPAFEEPEDHEAAALLRSLCRVPVVSISCRALARLGGVLNCISTSFGRLRL